MNSEIDPKVSEMSNDVLKAYDIIDDVFDIERTGRSIVIGLAIAALKRVERALAPDVMRARERTWTERRVRSIVDKEARRIDAYEIDNLNRMALAEARLEFNRSSARAAQLAAFLEHRDAAFHSPEVEAQVAIARGMDSAGDRRSPEGAGSLGPVTDRPQQCLGGVAGTRDQYHRTGGARR